MCLLSLVDQTHPHSADWRPEETVNNITHIESFLQQLQQLRLCPDLGLGRRNTVFSWCRCQELRFWIIQAASDIKRLIANDTKFVSKCYASWCNLYKLFYLHSLKVATGDKEPRPGAWTRSLRSNAEFQLRKPPVWPRFSNSNRRIYTR